MDALVPFHLWEISHDFLKGVRVMGLTTRVKRSLRGGLPHVRDTRLIYIFSEGERLRSNILNPPCLTLIAFMSKS